MREMRFWETPIVIDLVVSSNAENRSLDATHAVCLPCILLQRFQQPVDEPYDPDAVFGEAGAEPIESEDGFRETVSNLSQGGELPFVDALVEERLRYLVVVLLTCRSTRDEIDLASVGKETSNCLFTSSLHTTFSSWNPMSPVGNPAARFLNPRSVG